MRHTNKKVKWKNGDRRSEIIAMDVPTISFDYSSAIKLKCTQVQIEELNRHINKIIFDWWLDSTILSAQKPIVTPGIPNYPYRKKEYSMCLVVNVAFTARNKYAATGKIFEDDAVVQEVKWLDMLIGEAIVKSLTDELY